MKTKKIILQIFTGGFNENNIAFDDFKDKLLLMIERLPVDKVIIGWSLKREIYSEVKKLLEEYGIELYLWIPVFSEIGLMKDFNATKDYKGKEINRYSLQEGEDFQFYCPSSEENLLNFYKVFEEYFKDIGFTGVFLDKIRYGSFSNGIDAVFSCFCPSCLKVYKDKGLDIEKLKNEMESLKKGDKGYSNIPFNIIGYSQGKYRFSEKIWNDFFDIKSEIMLQNLVGIKDYFKNLGMKIGIDTFAPFISYFVGQDIEKMQQLVDFNKPMMYRITQAPAGLPFESNCLIKESTTCKFSIARDRFLNIIDIREYNKRFPIEFVKKELEIISNESQCDIYCGIEVNRKDGIAMVYPEYIRENLSGLNDSDIEGFVLSWDLSSAPEDNLEAVIDFFK